MARTTFASSYLSTSALIGALLGACGRPEPPARPSAEDYLQRCDLPGDLSAHCSACMGGNAEACLAVAVAYERGEQIPRDDLGMVAFEHRACRLHSGRGCTNLANSYRAHRAGRGCSHWTPGVRQQIPEWERHWDHGCWLSERSCDRKELAYECVSAARCRLVRGEPLAPRHVEQSALACTGGDRLGCTIALDWWTRDRDADPAEVAAVVGRICAADSLPACEAAATYQWLGLGGVADPDAARATFAELCKGGLDTACHAERGYVRLNLVLPRLAGATAPYPQAAIDAGLKRNRELPKEQVVIGFCVAADGSASNTVILDSSGNEDVDDGAAKGVRLWRFPTLPEIAQKELCLQVTFVLPPSWVPSDEAEEQRRRLWEDERACGSRDGGSSA